jgi:beta-lactamase superfamily II metal-dependent hydrolase
MIKRFLILALLLCGASSLNAQLNVSVINVGQGDAIFIELPSGRNVLIDGGPKAAPLMDFLETKGIKTLDNVVLTHPHGDHYTGLRAVFAKMSVANFYDTKLDNLDAVLNEDIRKKAAAEPGCALHYPEVGDKLDWDPQVSVQVLHSCPQAAVSTISEEINNCSIVLQFRYNGQSILFMGDVQASVENEIVGRFKNGVQADFLKVGHHGAPNATSAEFLSVVKPKKAYVSVGLNNSFGHPSKDTLDRLRDSGAQIFMTTDGTQSFSIPAPYKETSCGIPTAVSTAPADTVEDFKLIWNPPWKSPALDQLAAQAASAGTVPDAALPRPFASSAGTTGPETTNPGQGQASGALPQPGPLQLPDAQ